MIQLRHAVHGDRNDVPVINQPYIGFEGPIGAGKTTLAQLLALHLGAKLILEDVDGNAFLPDFYANRERWALSTQLAFLISRYEQLRTIPALRGRPVVADYTRAKDPIFARALLHDREVELYERLSVGLDASLSPPDLTVYVDARNDVLLHRIRGRNRPYEASIDAQYLDALRDAYTRHHNSTGRLQVLSFDTSDLNLRSESQLNSLYKKILAAASLH
ncbi:MAG TPA: deoxynucleoside kinase [Candidatus Baltobacteraceae bacterium]|jgi:deoxyguanosine kinase|nr:deoxynucleoside kinase [Candidatus Baltobacteraceae bacterium]